MAENISKEELEDAENITMILSLDDGSELECIVLTILEAGGNDYIALLPTDESEEADGEVYLYRYAETEDGEPELTNIDSDEEFEIVSDAFDEWLDEQEFDEIIEDEE